LVNNRRKVRPGAFFVVTAFGVEVVGLALATAAFSLVGAAPF
jgi:hypothetical protein